ncbi:MAG: nucleotidyltransferase [Lachnospiraceae bacterium]|nr:nucleotidyltransferase [Lachnospiraceae bacterium]
MNAVGIIAEYNPCHNGHLYHINKSKSDTGADCAVVIMSGNFMQRGTPAVMDKYTRAKCAILSGADLVIELPVIYSTGSAELFARGAISILNGLGNISHISFGSECSSLDRLHEIAVCLASESDVYKESLRKYISSGLNMPVARSHAFSELYGYDAREILSAPNNILAIEYMKALIRTGSSIIPYNITRRDNDYHDDFMTGSISSATAIRKHMESGETDCIRNAVSTVVYDIIQSISGVTMPITPDDMSYLLKYALRDKSAHLNEYMDVSDAMAVRMRNYLSSQYDDFTFLNAAAAVKTKDITFTRVCRAFTHIVLGITDNMIRSAENAGFPSYARILASSAQGRKFLGSIRKAALIPVISNCHDDIPKLNDICKELLMTDIKTSDIYNDIVYYKFGNKIKDDYRSRPLIL